MASDGADDSVASVHRFSRSAETGAEMLPGSVLARSSSCHSSVFSSPVSDLALNLEVLSTDGFSSQGSLSSEG